MQLFNGNISWHDVQRKKQALCSSGLQKCFILVQGGAIHPANKLRNQQLYR
jgi:hypothetical protein